MTDDTTTHGDVELETDPAAAAFTRLEREMALMRRAVEHLASERADIVIPDYAATLTEMAKRLVAMSRSIATIAEQPAMQLTPDTMAARIEAVAQSARREDHDQLIHARQDLGRAVQDMRAVVATTKTADEQKRRSWMIAGVGVFAGIVLWSFLPGTIARSAPERWHWPERMALHLLGASSAWEAGQLLMKGDNPEAWNAIVHASNLMRDNRKTIEECRKYIKISKKSARCNISLRNW